MVLFIFYFYFFSFYITFININGFYVCYCFWFSFSIYIYQLKIKDNFSWDLKYLDQIFKRCKKTCSVFQNSYLPLTVMTCLCKILCKCNKIHNRNVKTYFAKHSRIKSVYNFENKIRSKICNTFINNFVWAILYKHT